MIQFSEPAEHAASMPLIPGITVRSGGAGLRQVSTRYTSATKPRSPAHALSATATTTRTRRSEMTVRIDKSNEVWTVILSRPDVKNAVDGDHASQLSAAFRAFDSDGEARVA